MSRPFYIIGFMGTGKSSLAAYLKAYGTVVDVDATIESAIGMDIATYFDLYGEEAFRDRETEALRAVDADFVLTGGGVVERAQNMDWMNRRGEVVMLALSFEACWDRIKDSNRPLVLRGKNAVEALYMRRQPLYEKADFVVDASQTPPETAAEIKRLKEEGHDLD